MEGRPPKHVGRSKRCAVVGRSKTNVPADVGRSKGLAAVGRSKTNGRPFQKGSLLWSAAQQVFLLLSAAPKKASCSRPLEK